jgi:predicted metallo-beta-lactamase superfamily hydrolase
MKTIEILTKNDIVNDPKIQRVSNSAAALAVLQGIAVYTTKSQWKTEVRNKRIQELERVEKEKFKDIRVADGKVRKPHFKKGKPHGNPNKGSKGSHTQSQQRVQGQDRKAG